MLDRELDSYFKPRSSLEDVFEPANKSRETEVLAPLTSREEITARLENFNKNTRQISEDVIDVIRHDLTHELTLSEKYSVESPLKNLSYLRQVLDGQTNSCFPTSILNGWIHQGLLTTGEAQRIQDRLTTKYKNTFSTTGDHSFKSPPSRLMGIAEEVSDKRPALLSLTLNMLNPEEIKRIIMWRLQSNQLIVGGGGSHAILTVGYKEKLQKLTIVDPMSPKELKDKDTSQYITQVKMEASGANLVIIPPWMDDRK